jgi:hypothetical protein
VEAPVVNVTAPGDGAVVAGAVAVSAGASDNVGVVGVQFRVNGANLGGEDLSAPYTVEWNSLSVANGAYQVTAVARDAAGNTTTSAAVNVTVNNIVDVTGPVVVAITPAAGASGVATTTTVSAQFDEALDGATVNGSTFVLRDGAGAVVAASVGYNPATFTAVLTPGAALAPGVRYTATVVGGAADPRVKDVAGNALAASGSWSFTTTAPAGVNCPCSIWSAGATPAFASVNDPNAVELGVKFQTDVAGYITGLRFYKGAQNTGPHVGNLWSSSGQLLASAPFANETASGWQQVTFGAPVPVAANTTYVASYHTSSGYYAINNDYFATSGVTSTPLRALANGAAGGNGVYAYGPSSFPASSYRASNYWVDVVFVVN